MGELMQVQIGIALTVRLRDHIDRHTVDGDGDISPVIGIKPAEKDLLGLPTSLMLSYKKARHQTQHVLRGPRWQCIELIGGETRQIGQEYSVHLFTVSGPRATGSPAGTAWKGGK